MIDDVTGVVMIFVFVCIYDTNLAVNVMCLFSLTFLRVGNSYVQFCGHHLSLFSSPPLLSFHQILHPLFTTHQTHYLPLSTLTHSSPYPSPNQTHSQLPKPTPSLASNQPRNKSPQKSLSQHSAQRDDPNSYFLPFLSLPFLSLPFPSFLLPPF